MRERRRRAIFARAADIALLAVFIGLSAFAFGRVSAGVGALMDRAGGVQFTDLYRPGQNPWAGAMIEPLPAAGRYANLGRVRRPFR